MRRFSEACPRACWVTNLYQQGVHGVLKQAASHMRRLAEDCQVTAETGCVGDDGILYNKTYDRIIVACISGQQHGNSKQAQDSLSIWSSGRLLFEFFDPVDNLIVNTWLSRSVATNGVPDDGIAMHCPS